jgi:hypothetical protein
MQLPAKGGSFQHSAFKYRQRCSQRSFETDALGRETRVAAQGTTHEAPADS